MAARLLPFLMAVLAGVAQALAIVDVDQFASANDVLGHDYGDFDAHDGLWTMAERTADDVLARAGATLSARPEALSTQDAA